MLHEMGVETGIDLERAAGVRRARRSACSAARSAPPADRRAGRLERLRRDVAALAAMQRDSAGVGERGAANWVAGRLREARRGRRGGRAVPLPADVRARPRAHHAAGLAPRPSRIRRPRARARRAGLAELEGSGRTQWLRRAPARGRGRERRRARPRGRRRERHDRRRRPPRRGPRRPLLAPAARRLTAARNARRRAIDGYLQPAAAGYALAALRRAPPAPPAPRSSPPRSPRRSTSPGRPRSRARATTPRASPRCSRSRPSSPPTRCRGTDVVLLSAGCEESGMGGMAAYLRDHAPDPARTFVVGLDTLGAGTPIQLRAEGVIRAHAYGERDLDASTPPRPRAGLPPPPRWRLGGWTDPILARFAGIPAVSILSMGGGDDPRVPPADRHAGARRLGLRRRLPGAGARGPQNWGWRFSRNALTPSAKSGRRGAPLLRDDLELERRGERRARATRPSPAWRARPRSARRRAARPASCSTAASSSSAGATRLARPIRSASSAADQLPGHDQLLRPPEADDLRQPRGAADVGDQARSASRAARRSRRSASTRRSHASASSSAPPMHAPWIWQITGLGISSARFHASRHARRNVAQPLRRRRERGERAEVHPGGEHRAVAADDDAADVRVVGRRAQRGARREHQLVVERVALLRPVQDDVADGTAIF